VPPFSRRPSGRRLIRLPPLSFGWGTKPAAPSHRVRWQRERGRYALEPAWRSASDITDVVMSNPPDPRVLFAAERTLLAWQRSSVALMAFGFVIERFSLFLSALRHEPENPGRHLFSLVGRCSSYPARCWRRACLEHQLSTIRQDLAEPGRIIGLPDRSGFSYQRGRRRSGDCISDLSARRGPQVESDRDERLYAPGLR